jgi:GT2 family glycosyltransferase
MSDKVIIIPIHNQLPYVKKCVASVILRTDEPKIILIDDGSDKETADWIKDCELMGVVTLRNEKAQGFSNACNKGIQYALDNYDFNCLCLLNSDAEVVTVNWFDKVEACYLSDDNVGVASVMSNNALTQTIKNIDEYLKSIDGKPTVLTNIPHGFCYFMGKKVIQKIGIFDAETFVAYGGEDDYSLRSIKNGFINLVVGSVFVKHYGEASYSSSVRTKFVKKTLPTLQKRWGYRYVSDCVKHAIKVGEYINNY